MSSNDTSYLAILNPAAGGGRCGRRAPAALASLRQQGLVIEEAPTSRAGEGSEIVRQAWAEGRRRFLAIGGDGTSFEVVNGLFSEQNGGEAEEPPVLGMLPLGTGNSFLRDFGITTAEAAMDALVRGRTRPIDVVRAEHEDGVLHYINLLSVGFSAEAGGLTNRRFKPLGALGYIVSVLITAARMRHPAFPYALDGDSLDGRPCTLLSFSNSRFTGGSMMMAPSANTGDGELDVIRIGQMGRLSFVRAFPQIFRGTHLEVEGVSERRAKEVRFELDEAVDVMVDGEVLKLALRSLLVLPGALSVVA